MNYTGVIEKLKLNDFSTYAKQTVQYPTLKKLYINFTYI